MRNLHLLLYDLYRAFKPNLVLRVTSVVRGVKGARCQEITKPFHDAIGTVIDSTPTEDMFEQELVVDEKVVQRIDGQWDGTSSW